MTNRRLLLIFTLSALFHSFTSAQVGINFDGSPPDSSAGLDVNFPDKGFLPPRLTFFQIKTIENPATGLIVFNIDSLDLYIYTGICWVSVLNCDDRDTIYPWSCNDFIVDSRDSRTYETILAGTQCWMAENLAADIYRNGISIPNVTNNTEWGALSTGAWCWYTNDSASYEGNYGKMYNWFAVNDPGGLCPEGWHPPSNDELTTLMTFLGGESAAGGKLKSTGTIEAGTGLWATPNYGATNETGFTAHPGGYRSWWNGSFGAISGSGYFWTASVESDWMIWNFYMNYAGAEVTRSSVHNRSGLSVRCLMDQNY